jgi:hypothetical protein
VLAAAAALALALGNSIDDGRAVEERGVGHRRGARMSL